MKTLAVLGLVLLAGCGIGSNRSRPQSSDVKDLAADTSAKNVALFFGSPTNLAGVPVDIRKNDVLFNDESYKFGFEVNAINLATRRMILETTRQKAAEVGPGGTLLWYFSGHGMENGAMYTQDEQMLFFREVAAQIKAGRTTPLKRLVVVIDNCFSGTNPDGADAIIPQSGSQLLSSDADFQAARDAAGTFASAAAADEALAMPTTGPRSMDKLYEQALVITSSRSSETSLDGSAGGIFSEAWRRTLTSLRTNKTATLGDLAKQTTALTISSSGGHHTPVYRAYPSEQILGELLFGATPQTVVPVQPNTGGATLQPVISTELFAALTPAEAAGDSSVLISASKRIDSVALCIGPIAICWATPRADLLFAVAGGLLVDGKTIFRSTSRLAPTNGQTYTLLAYDSAKKLIEARQVLLQQR